MYTEVCRLVGGATAELKATHENLIDHTTVLSSSLETQLCTSVVINSYLQSLSLPVCDRLLLLANVWRRDHTD